MSEFDNQSPGMTPEEIESLEAQRAADYERQLAPFRAFGRKVNAGLRTAIAAGNVTDEEVDAMRDTIPPWVQGSIENPIKYFEGDPHTVDGAVWICRQSHTCTSAVEKPGPVTLALWRRATPEGVAKWQENTEYFGPNNPQGKPQSEVIDPFDNQHYLCLQGHTSQAGWEPTKVPALWQKKE